MCWLTGPLLWTGTPCPPPHRISPPFPPTNAQPQSLPPVHVGATAAGCSRRWECCAAAAGAPKDSVTSFELFKVPPRWLFLRVETENGIVGWGEPNIEGYSDTVGAAVTEMMGSVVGQPLAADPRASRRLSPLQIPCPVPLLLSLLLLSTRYR